MLVIVHLVLLASLLSVSEGLGENFASKTSYFKVANNDESPIEVEGCSPELVWMLVRHGTRNPADFEILEMEEKLPPLRDQIVQSWLDGKGSMAEEDIIKLEEWSLGVQLDDQMKLTESGKNELSQMGQRWASRVDQLREFQVEVRSSDKQRCIDSGLAFLDGYLGSSEDLDVNIDNHLMRFYAECTEYNDAVGSEAADSENNLFMESSDWINMVASVIARTGVNMNQDELNLAWNMCRYETAWEPLSEISSPWCAIFSEQDFSVFEFSEDLKSYYHEGSGFEITSLMTQPLFQDVFTKLDELNTELSPNRSILNFGHSPTVNPMMVALGLFADDEQLLASDWNDKDYQWKTSTMATFATNIALLFLDCQEEGMNVMTFHDGTLVQKQPSCGQMICPLADFEAAYKHFADQDFNSVCGI